MTDRPPRFTTLAYAHLFLALGRNEESLTESQRALAIDPRSVEMNHHLGVHYFITRQYDQAIAQFLKTLELDPDFADSHYYLGAAYLLRGMPEEAIAELKKALTLRGAPHDHAMLGYAYAHLGRTSEAQRILQGLKEQAKARYVPAYLFALLYTALGQRDVAFQWLEKAYEDRDIDLSDACVDRLRSDPRFQDLVRRMNLPAVRAVTSDK